MKYFKKQNNDNIKVLLLFILTPLIGVKFYEKINEKDLKLIDELSKKYGISGEERVALIYEARTSRDLFTDSLISCITISILVTIIILSILKCIM